MVFFPLLLMASFFAALSGYGERGEAAATPCRCLPSDLCSDDDAAVNGQGLLDVRIPDKICQNYFEICCESPIPNPDLPSELRGYKGCGFQNPIGVIPRITSDSKEAGFAELPWTVVVLARDVGRTERNMYKCGGSLIHPQVVLTAAHCIFDVNSNLLTVRLGEWDTKSQEEPFPHQDRSVQDILTHPNFHPGSLKNDVGLLFLTEPIILTANVGLICLPPPNYQMEEATCIVGGWGKDTLKKGKYSTILRKMDLPLVPKDKCMEALRRTRLGTFFKLHESFICAGGESNRDTCKGDGGSPLVCPVPGEKDRYLQMGIVSWGIGCGERDVPGVYVTVALFTKWIDEELSVRNFDTSSYKY